MNNRKLCEREAVRRLRRLQLTVRSILKLSKVHGPTWAQTLNKIQNIWCSGFFF